MGFTILLKRGTSVEWASLNPVLREGEPGIESDTNQLKLGNGESRWTDLPYLSTVSGSTGEVSDAEFLAHINSTTPHPAYDDGPSFLLLYENAKV